MGQTFKPILTIIILIMITPNLFAKTNFSADGLIGYNGGLGIQTNFIMSKFAKGLPFDIQLGIGYIKMDPGKPDAARRIFINNNTNGAPEESGKRWDFRFDFLRKVTWFSLKQLYFYGGPRYSRFTGNFKYVGGNEDFDITSNQWGLGVGLKAYFNINKSFNFVTTSGVDYYLKSAMTGHDTTYDPDGTNTNGRENYTYDDADEAVNNPKFELNLMIGLNYSL